MSLDAGARKKIIRAARQDGWDRGCTCGTRPRAAILDEGPPRVRVGIEHLVGCPLWMDRDLDNLPADTPPDSLSTVKV